MRTVIVISVLLLTAGISLAQIAGSGFYIGWSGMKPLYTEFVSKTSTQGLTLGYTRFYNERIGFGFDAGYNILKDYVPLATYPFTGGAITTDLHNYMYQYSAVVNGQYYFSSSERLVPYALLGVGAALTEYRQFFNVYNNSDNQPAFMVRPEVGLLFRVKPYSAVGFKAAVCFDYATNNTEYFNLKNFYGIGFKLAAVLFND